MNIKINIKTSKKLSRNENKMLGFSKPPLIFLIVIVVLAGIIGSFFYFREGIPQPPSAPAVPTPPASMLAGVVSAKRLIQPEDIILEKSDVVPKIPQYELPLEVTDISNYQRFSEKIQLSPQALSLLGKNGFVVIETPKDIADNKISSPLFPTDNYAKDDFATYYETLADKDLPVFITTDSLLHYYHIFFDVTLLRMERDIFYDDVWQMSKELFDDAVEQYENSEGDLKEAARRNIAYLSVALELLEPDDNQAATKENLKEEINCYGPDEYCDNIIAEQLEGGELFKFFTEQEVEIYSFAIPSFVKDLVQQEIELIEKHEGWKYSPVFIYKEDYSQYVPRGHYTKSEKLKNYFKSMMWYGRMTALIQGSDLIPEGKSLRKIQEEGALIGIDDTKGLISARDAKIQTLQASLIANKFSESQSIQQRWQRMYAITGFFVGLSDDLGPYEYSAVLDNLFENHNPQEIEENYSDVQNSLSGLAYNPKIYSGLDACQMVMPCPPLSDEEIQALKVQAQKLLEATKGFRLMGQRFTIDSWLFSEIVSPYSGEYTGQKLPLPTEEKPFTFCWDDYYSGYRDNRPFTWVKTDVGACPPPATREVRGFPRGLDIMALFGSDRAKEILTNLRDTEYSDYEEKFSELKKEIDSLPQDEWFKNVYWNWLYVLKSLLVEFDDGHQTFMQTEAWQDKELNTALASWSELRHDTILYVKQSYTIAELGAGVPEIKIVGYVEPAPDFYARLLNLTKMTKNGLNGLLTEEQLTDLNINDSLDKLASMLDRLLEISEKELENEVLTEEEYGFIKDFGETSTWLIEAIAGKGDVDQDVFKTVLIADVHTDGNTKKVLEEGVGYIKTLVVAYKLPEGHILLGVGPAFSYYEFKHPMDDRLTDGAWRGMLDTEHPPEPEWTKSFSE